MQTVYVPVPNALPTIAPKSGIVGTRLPDADHIQIDYEGAVYNQANVQTFADKISIAAGRHTSQYPAVTRMVVPSDSLVGVGVWDDMDGTVTVTNASALAAWLQVEAIAPEELLATGVYYEQRRALQHALQSPDPAIRAVAEREARRLNLPLPD